MFSSWQFLHIYDSILLSHKMSKVMPFAATWMQLEILIISEVKSERERQIPYDITYNWNLISSTNEHLLRKENHGLGEETCGCLMGGGGSGRDRELGLIRHNLE